MTQQEAKEISLEVWEYLEAHPEIDRKTELPKKILKKINGLFLRCPLCCFIYKKHAICPNCPLKRCNTGSLYSTWIHAFNPIERQKAASKIVELIKAWEPKEDI